MTSYSDRLARERAEAAKAESAPKLTGNTLVDIENALDAKDIAIAMRKVVAKAVAQRVLDDEMSGGDLVRLLAMLNERVDGKVADKVEHSGNLTLEAVFESIMGKTTGLPDPAWFDVVDNAHSSVVDSEGAIGHTLPVLDGVVLDSDNPDPVPHPEPDVPVQAAALDII